jgi:hypothetical protein
MASGRIIIEHCMDISARGEYVGIVRGFDPDGATGCWRACCHAGWRR